VSVSTQSARMPVLVLGGEGMLGHMMVTELSRRRELAVGWTQHSNPSEAYWLEALEGPNGLCRLARRHGQPRYLINCIGVLRCMVDAARPQAVRRTIAINSLFPHDLALFAQSTGARVIHLSTDGVFRGVRQRYYEDDPADSADIYGRSKALGESEAATVLTIRCSVVGPDTRNRRGLLEWFRSQPDGSEIAGYTDHWWNGATSLQVAQLCARIITEAAFDKLREEGAVHHFCPNTEVTKYELLDIMKSVFHNNVSIKPQPAPGGPIRLLLATRYRGLTDMFGCGIQMRNAIAELAAAC
jgi:dTDP-4-dehydrorhamnose reductase